MVLRGRRTRKIKRKSQATLQRILGFQMHVNQTQETALLVAEAARNAFRAWDILAENWRELCLLTWGLSLDLAAFKKQTSSLLIKKNINFKGTMLQKFGHTASLKKVTLSQKCLHSFSSQIRHKCVGKSQPFLSSGRPLSLHGTRGSPGEDILWQEESTHLHTAVGRERGYRLSWYRGLT